MKKLCLISANQGTNHREFQNYKKLLEFTEGGIDISFGGIIIKSPNGNTLISKIIHKEKNDLADIFQGSFEDNTLFNILFPSKNSQPFSSYTEKDVIAFTSPSLNGYLIYFELKEDFNLNNNKTDSDKIIELFDKANSVLESNPPLARECIENYLHLLSKDTNKYLFSGILFKCYEYAVDQSIISVDQAFKELNNFRVSYDCSKYQIIYKLTKSVQSSKENIIRRIIISIDSAEFRYMYNHRRSFKLDPDLLRLDIINISDPAHDFNSIRPYSFGTKEGVILDGGTKSKSLAPETYGFQIDSFPMNLKEIYENEIILKGHKFKMENMYQPYDKFMLSIKFINNKTIENFTLFFEDDSKIVQFSSVKSSHQ